MWWKMVLFIIIVAVGLWMKFKAIDSIVADVEEEKEND